MKDTIETKLLNGCRTSERVGTGVMSPSGARELCKGIKCGEEDFLCSKCKCKITQHRETKKEMIAQFREFTPEIISRFGFDDQMDNAMEFTKKRFAVYTEGEEDGN